MCEEEEEENEQEKEECLFDQMFFLVRRPTRGRYHAGHLVISDVYKQWSTKVANPI